MVRLWCVERAVEVGAEGRGRHGGGRGDGGGG